eukprot:TRINITY_DN21287_c0_g2_i1.p1 TRINITY_DN21287_c0_g2~~TRINITY_DN21287_c0_g2_i1.p1  ORF type:complete len:291 (-),score=39.23 TRINITY_DN21287_c0_g2_i1:573-1445(-)
MFHNDPASGHSGVKPTTHRLATLFYWKGLKKDVRTHIAACDVCQRNKYDTTAPAGLLQPFPIPATVWSSINMDFIESLPKSHGYNVIFVVVDRLSKYAYFIPLCHPFTALIVAQVFFDTVFRLHGLPQVIISDRDSIFLSAFWKELFRLQGFRLHYSTSYHPQTDGQTEVVNRCLETYLRCVTEDYLKQWSKWLPLAEWWYNTTFHSTIQTTPYEVLYGQPPLIHTPYTPGDSSVAAVDRSLIAREVALRILKQHLLMAQERMKKQADKHRRDKKYQVGDWVYIKLKPYR